MTKWREVPARRIFRIVNGGTPTTDAENWDGGLLWATPVDLGESNGGIITSTGRTLSRQGLETGSVAVPGGSLVVSTRAPIGYVAQTVEPIAFNQGCRALVPDRSIDIRYYRFVVVSLTERLQSQGQGSTFVELSSDALASTPVPLPSKEAQRAIADFLDAETARIDALIAKKRRVVDVAVSKVGAHTTDLTAAAVILELNNGATRVPRGWQAMRLRRCFTAIDYGIGEASKASGEVAVLGMGNIDDRGGVGGGPGGFVDWVDPRLRLRVGDLLFNRTNSLAKVGKLGLVRQLVGPTTFASYLVRLRTSSLADAEYLNYVLNTDEVLGMARSTALPSIGQANLNPSRYGELRIALPSVERQRRIVAELDTARCRVDALVGRQHRQLALLQERRQALITAAVTGALDIPGAA